jgi:hypothetical protein
MNIWGISPFSILIILIYALGFRLVAKTQKFPMWFPKQTEMTSKT